jgi:hypothetical protein
VVKRPLKKCFFNHCVTGAVFTDHFFWQSAIAAKLPIDRYASTGRLWPSVLIRDCDLFSRTDKRLAPERHHPPDSHDD